MRISCGVEYQFPLEAEDSGLRFRISAGNDGKGSERRNEYI